MEFKDHHTTLLREIPDHEGRISEYHVLDYQCESDNPRAYLVRIRPALDGGLAVEQMSVDDTALHFLYTTMHNSRSFDEREAELRIEATRRDNLSQAIQGAICGS